MIADTTQLARTSIGIFVQLLVFLSCGCNASKKPTMETRNDHAPHTGKYLSRSVGIETLGGVFTPLIAKGTELPTVHEEVFSTAVDNQPSVEISILIGDSTMAKDNLTLGRFQIGGIRPAGRGIPKIQVRLTVDTNEAVQVSAKDLQTGESNDVKILHSGVIGK